MAAAVVGAGALSAAGAKMEALTCSTAGSSSIASGAKASFFVGSAGAKRMVALRSRNAAMAIGRRAPGVVRA
jgi:hypothetical protein